MKKELPKPAIYGTLVVFVALLSFVLFKAASGPGELPRPTIYYDPAHPLPDHLMNLPAADREKMIEHIKEVGTPKPGYKAPEGGGMPAGPTSNPQAGATSPSEAGGGMPAGPTSNPQGG